MIELNWDQVFVIYLILLLSPLFGIWFYFHFRKKNKKLNLNEKKLVTCEYCLSPFLMYRLDKSAKCPICQSYNRYG